VTPLRAKLRDELGTTVGRGTARARILTAAIDAFARNGVADTRVEDILVAAGMSRRTFYQHFDDKVAVVHALFELVTTHLAARFSAAVARAGDPMTAIDEALAMFLELHRTDRDIVRALVEESLRADSSLYELRVRFRRGIMRGLDAMFVAVTRRQLDPFVALALVSAVEGISLELLARKPRDADFVRARGVIAGLIAMICAHPAELPAVAAAAA
jgi:AcrR family transcriptional regulator